jgi:serine/threonine-protein kinase
VQVAEGTIIAERYRVETVLGQGGMGIVLAARHLGLDERVAIKLLLREDPEEPLDVSRFHREARIAAKLRSEHTARVHDIGALPDGTPYLVMEYLAGQDLGHYLAARGPLPIGEAVDFVLQACEALAEAHALGVVHRDLKPSNLFLARRHDGSPLVKVLDFGVSKLAPVGGLTSLTRTSDVIGSPLYMSPEQMISAKHVDTRTDLWALGVILYELLTGKVPWIAGSLAALCARVIETPPPSMLAERPELPAELEAVVFRCLAKTTAHRMPDVGSLARALAPFAPKGASMSVQRASRASAMGEATVRMDGPPVPSSGDRTMLSPGTASTADNAATVVTAPPSAAAQVTTAPGRRQTRSVVTAVGLVSLGVGAAIASAVVLLRPTPAPTPPPPSAAPPASSPPTATTVEQPAPTTSAPPVASTTPSATAQPSARRPAPGPLPHPPPSTPPTARPITTDDFGTRH